MRMSAATSPQRNCASSRTRRTRPGISSATHRSIWCGQSLRAPERIGGWLSLVLSGGVGGGQKRPFLVRAGPGPPVGGRLAVIDGDVPLAGGRMDGDRSVRGPVRVGRREQPHLVATGPGQLRREPDAQPALLGVVVVDVTVADEWPDRCGSL